jgi:hypothetical protein
VWSPCPSVLAIGKRVASGTCGEDLPCRSTVLEQTASQLRLSCKVCCRFLENSHSDLLHVSARRRSLWEQLFWAGSFSLPALSLWKLGRVLTQELCFHICQQARLLVKPGGNL